MPAPARVRTRSIATVCLSGTLPDKLEAAAAAGFAGVEIFENDLLTFDGAPAEVRGLCADLGLEVLLFQPFRDFEAVPDPARRRRNLDRAERKFDTMQALGAGLVLVCSNVGADAVDDPARAADDLRAMAERAAARGLRVCYEALAWGRHVNRWRQAWDVVRRADHPALGLCLDSFHTLCLGDDLSGLGEVPAEKLFFLQLADAPRLAMDALSWSRHHRLFPGQGELDVAAFLRAALDAGYAGPLSLEIFNDEFRAAPARRIARDGLRSLVWLEERVGEAALPAPPRLSGVAFVEFAVDRAARAELGAFLAPLGFRRAGTHRSKDVELWRAGAANLVLNAEPDSAAAERFAQLGPSVCALALRVDEPARAVARAEALLYPVWRERVGHGERRIPAVRAPDGTLVYLVEDAAGQAFWDDDFAVEDAPDESPILGVDHAAQAVDPGMLDGFALFYRALFGLEPDALWELPDPYGLVRSRAFSAGGVRVPLNASESGRTGTGRFVSALAGAGVHHVALAVRDAGAVAPGALIEPPANHYDDLAARFGLDEAELARLAAGRLMFDRDAAGGEFRHGYTRSFRGRFFLELCERRGGYAGYGAANAPLRMAAQRRAEALRPSDGA